MQSIIETGRQKLAPTYRTLPTVITRGEGAKLFDKEGKSYIDFISGIAVSSLGYGHPELVNAIFEQAANLIHTSNMLFNEPSVKLAAELCEVSFADRVFFCNSGAEANETMIKMARKYFYDQGQDRHEIICMDKAFHGRTLATISCTGQTAYQRGFEPLLPGFKTVPFNDIQALKNAITPKTAAIIVEPILGEGGLVVPQAGYLKQVRDLCDEHGCLMLLDEVQTGIGRTGKLFAYMHEDITPDVMSLAKGLGGGMPIGAVLATEKASQALSFPSHGSTFGGNAVCCAAARVVLKTVQEPKFLEHVNQMGAILHQHLQELREKYPEQLVALRGRGLFYGLQCHIEPTRLRELAFNHGLLTNVCGKIVMRFAPPLVIDESSLREGLDIFSRALVEWVQEL